MTNEEIKAQDQDEGCADATIGSLLAWTEVSYCSKYSKCRKKTSNNCACEEQLENMFPNVSANLKTLVRHSWNVSV